MQEFAELETEPPAEMASDAALGEWPSAGAVTFENVELRYREGLPLVVKV